MASFASSYIPTQAAQVTRAADRISLATSAFPVSDSEGTLVIENNYDGGSALSPDARAACQLGFGAARALIYNASGTANGGFISNTNAQAILNGIAATDAFVKAAFGWKLDDVGLSLNGAAPSTDMSATVPTVSGTSFYIGSTSSANAELRGHIKRIKYIPRRATNAELVAFSA